MWLVGVTHQIWQMVRILLKLFEENNKKNYNFRFCFAATTSSVKMQVSLQGVSQERCKKMYKPFGVKLNVGQMCVGGEEGLDSCRGTFLSTSILFSTAFASNFHFLSNFGNFIV